MLSSTGQENPGKPQWEPFLGIEISFPEKELRSSISLRSVESFRFVRKHRVEPFVLDIACSGGGITFIWMRRSFKNKGKEQKI
ncbi:MAG: hypothetical protein EPO39_14915 [Candidatus Manganitrophaceae bacterium]|nr:MAG: hypothetical protein EPO39_14915 [Candidatus Manganitrophaceae bacterium]